MGNVCAVALVAGHPGAPRRGQERWAECVQARLHGHWVSKPQNATVGLDVPIQPTPVRRGTALASAREAFRLEKLQVPGSRQRSYRSDRLPQFVCRAVAQADALSEVNELGQTNSGETFLSEPETARFSQARFQLGTTGGNVRSLETGPGSCAWISFGVLTSDLELRHCEFLIDRARHWSSFSPSLKAETERTAYESEPNQLATDSESRRSFIKKAATAAAAVSATNLPKTPVMAEPGAIGWPRHRRNDRIAVAYIGVGVARAWRKSAARRTMQENNIVQAAICDLYQ